MSEEEWKQVLDTCIQAINKLITFRKAEGKTLDTEFKKESQLLTIVCLKLKNMMIQELKM